MTRAERIARVEVRNGYVAGESAREFDPHWSTSYADWIYGTIVGVDGGTDGRDGSEPG